MDWLGLQWFCAAHEVRTLLRDWRKGTKLQLAMAVMFRKLFEKCSPSAVVFIYLGLTTSYTSCNI